MEYILLKIYKDDLLLKNIDIDIEEFLLSLKSFDGALSVERVFLNDKNKEKSLFFLSRFSSKKDILGFKRYLSELKHLKIFKLFYLKKDELLW